MRRAAMASVVAALLAAPAAAAQEHQHAATPGEKLGAVHFETSCSAAAQPQVDRAVALLHSFEFGSAIEAFDRALATDPSCGITQWGVALSRRGNPFAVGTRPASQTQQGLDAIDKARKAGLKTDRERGYVDAAAKLYTDADRLPQSVRVAAYRDAMASLAATYRGDTEASIFYALSLTASEDINDKTYSSRLKAIAILEPLFAKQPEHPGLAHYIIHSNDVPTLAPKALDAARRYAKIAPSAPHALHMPSHTFTRVGSWQESIDSNVAAAAVAHEQHETGEELHASDYQMYAYLQTAQDTAAKRILDSLPAIVSGLASARGSAAPPSAIAFATAAIPARWTLERGAWTEAAALETRPSGLPYVDALTMFARALGAARSGNLAAARSAAAELGRLRDREAQMNERYWTEQIDIQRRAASAWATFAEGRSAEAIADMRGAAEAEDRTEKAAITPGPIAPARELLGEMLLATNDPAAALKEFEATLVKEPNRLRTRYGAATAARRSGNEAAAREHLAKLLEMCARADRPGRPELQDARSVAAR